MKSRTVLLVGPRSNEDLTYGMSMGFDLLIAGFEDQKLPHIVIDRSAGMTGRKVGTFSTGGSIATLLLLFSFLTYLPRVGIIYLTIGISRAGCLRDMLMIWLGWLFRKRIVLHLKGGGFLRFYETNPGWFKFLMRRIIGKVDTIIVLGETLRDEFSFITDVDSKLAVVPNGLPKELEHGELKAPKKILLEQTLKLLYLSNMIPSKGYLDILEACRILHFERLVPIHCDFCGAFVVTVNDEGDRSPAQAEVAFRQLIKKKGLEDIVHYHGTVRGEKKIRKLQNAHLFLLPTAYPWEGQPISIIEALAFATPVISTRYRGIPEQVIDGYNGFLVSHHSPEQIAEAVEKMWRDPARYEGFSHNALAHFQKNFTQSAHLNRLIPLVIGLKE